MYKSFSLKTLEALEENQRFSKTYESFFAKEFNFNNLCVFCG
jgi:hypothetical protein